MEPVTAQDLTALMQQKRWTQDQLATALGASSAAVSHWIAGRRNIGPYYARKVREMMADPNATTPATARERILSIVDDLPEDALPIAAAILEGLAEHYGAARSWQLAELREFRDPSITSDRDQRWRHELTIYDPDGIESAFPPEGQGYGMDRIQADKKWDQTIGWMGGKGFEFAGEEPKGDGRAIKFKRPR